MGLQDTVGIQSRRFRYEKLIRAADDHEKLAIRPPRRRWVKKINGGLKGLRLSRSRKLTFKALSAILIPSSRIANIYAHIIDRIIKMDIDLYPNFNFSTHWGLPVKSHPYMC